MPRVVVFDLGGVLVDWNPRHLYRKLFDAEEQMEWFLDNVCNHAWNLQQDRGRPFAEGVAELSERFPEYAELIEAYDRRWLETLGGEIAGTVRLLEDLADRGVPVYLLTNSSAEKFPLAARRFPFLERFSGMVISGREGVCKPEPEIYAILCDRYDIDPNRAIFIDDSEQNVRGARRFGLHAVLFESSDRLRAELADWGLIE